MIRTTVGVLRGGPSSEYQQSLKTGATIMQALPEDRYDVRDIFVDKAGYWHLRGIPSDPAQILSQMDVVLNALHGRTGEDGAAVRILEHAGVPYAGARPHEANVAFNRRRAREVLREAGVLVPVHTTFSLGKDSDRTTGDMAKEVFRQFGPPYVVRLVHDRAHAHIRIAPTIHALPDAIGDVLDERGQALVEEYIRGHDASVGLIEGFRNEDIYALPPVHTIAPEGVYLAGLAPHDDGTIRHECPSHFSHEHKEILVDAAKKAHAALGLSHFSRADFRLTPYGKAYLMDMSIHPALHEGAAFPAMLASVGSSTREFLEHAIGLARRS
jgi:D-alanine-D-alanine ligase